VSKGRTKRRRLAVDRQQLLILLAAAVMAGSFFLLVLWPKQKDLSALGEAVKRERGAIGEKVRLSREGVYVGARIAALRKASGELSRRLPAGPDLAAFLGQVAEQVAREPLVRHEIERTEASATTEAVPGAPVRLRLAGPFDAVYRCLAAVEGLDRLTQIRRLAVTRTDADGNVLAEVDWIVYYLPGPERPGSAGSGKAEATAG
jgi:Tfp pilus assembly protein PilO